MIALIKQWFIGWIIGPAGKLLALVLALLATIGAVYMRGRSEGAGAERQKQAEQTIKRMETRDEVEDNVRRTPADARRERLRKWAGD